MIQHYGHKNLFSVSYLTCHTFLKRASEKLWRQLFEKPSTTTHSERSRDAAMLRVVKTWVYPTENFLKTEFGGELIFTEMNYRPLRI